MYYPLLIDDDFDDSSFVFQEIRDLQHLALYPCEEARHVLVSLNEFLSSTS